MLNFLIKLNLLIVKIGYVSISITIHALNG
jgi:hypothetical protein